MTAHTAPEFPGSPQACHKPPPPPDSLAAAAPELVREGGAHCPPATLEPPHKAPPHVSCALPGSPALQDLQIRATKC